MKNDLIIINPDAATRTAYDTWVATLKTEEKANLNVVEDKYIVSVPDPDDLVKATRDGLIDLVEANAETPTDIVRIRWRGTEVLSTGIIVQGVADPPEEPE